MTYFLSSVHISLDIPCRAQYVALMSSDWIQFTYIFDTVKEEIQFQFQHTKPGG